MLTVEELVASDDVLFAATGITDTALLRQLRLLRLDPDAPTPSCEALLHAFLPFPHVDHSHPDALISLACTPFGEATARKVFGARMAWVDYIRPGFTLSQQIARGVLDRPGVLHQVTGVFTRHDVSIRAAEQEGLGRAIIARLLDGEDAATVAERGQARTLVERQVLAGAVFDSLFRLGRLQPLLDDPAVENVLITGHDRVVVERADGSLVDADPVADSDEELLDFLSFVAGRADNPRPFSPSQPSLHLRLEDGSRLAAAQDTARPSVVIRRHRVRRVTLADLVDWRTVSPVMASFLAAAVKARRSIVVSGGQGDGKTTLVRALCAEIDPWEAIGTFETEHELFLHELPEQHRIVHALSLIHI